MIAGAGRGHIGGSLSDTDILVALYHGQLLRFDPNNPGWEKRDRLIMSKGHASESLYAVLAGVGFFDVQVLETYGKAGSVLGGHPDHLLPGIEISTGSLGHGLGIAAGLALAAKLNGEDHLSVAMLGDGECFEGSIWEAAVFGAQNNLSRLVAIVDRNGQATMVSTKPLEPLRAKWEAFGWEVQDLNGHSFEEIAKSWKYVTERTSSKPIALLANTVKGKGVSFMEGVLNWHHNVPRGEQLALAREELSIGC